MQILTLRTESGENFPQLLQADKCLTHVDEVECKVPWFQLGQS